MTPLDAWMTATKRPTAWLAEQLGCAPSQASRIRRGKSRTTAERAFQIEKMTRGKVKAADVLLVANDRLSQSKAA